jgi:hypothetical protein
VQKSVVAPSPSVISMGAAPFFQPSRAAFRIKRPVNMYRRISSISGPSILFTRRPRVVR